MKVKVGQLFVRDIYGCKEENTYLVCGLVKTDEPLDVETIHTITANDVSVVGSEEVGRTTRGQGLDGVMTSPLWRVKI